MSSSGWIKDSPISLLDSEQAAGLNAFAKAERILDIGDDGIDSRSGTLDNFKSALSVVMWGGGSVVEGSVPCEAGCETPFMTPEANKMSTLQNKIWGEPQLIGNQPSKCS